MITINNKTDAISFYHSLERFGIKPGLERIAALLHRLGDPQDDLKYIHVAGTNGKGSVCTELSNILRCAGFRTGLYTSPYVIDFKERIQVDNQMISDGDLCGCTQAVADAMEELRSENIEITEFEAITAAAFLHFKNAACDIVVLETGLGGRYDATNIIKTNICSVITSVSLDHTKILGNTVKEIAYEKCGIIKNGSPVVYGKSQSDDFKSVARAVASKLDSPVYEINDSDDYPYREYITGTEIKFRDNIIRIPFAGEHQKKNALLVLNTIEIIRRSGYNISDSAIKNGMEESFIPARTEIISRSPLVILDGCHNPDSTKALADLLKKHLKGRKLLGFSAMMSDKDTSANLRNLTPYFTEIVFTRASNPRSEAPEKLADFASSLCRTKAFDNPDEALDYINKSAAEYDGLIVFGSLYFASDVRDKIRNHYKY